MIVCLLFLIPPQTSKLIMNNKYRFNKGIRELIISISEIGISFLGALLAVRAHSNLSIWFILFSGIFGIASIFEMYDAVRDINGYY